MLLVPADVDTVTGTSVGSSAGAGAIAVIEESELIVKLIAGFGPKWTAVAPVKFDPLIITWVPPAAGPLCGASSLTFGICPSVPTARLNCPPVAIAVTSLSPTTDNGSFLLIVVPSPNCPHSFQPKAFTEPLLSNARLFASPAEIAVTSLRSLTATGTSVGAPCVPVVPSPSCPSPLPPQVLRFRSSATPGSRRLRRRSRRLPPSH